MSTNSIYYSLKTLLGCACKSINHREFCEFCNKTAWFPCRNSKHIAIWFPPTLPFRSIHWNFLRSSYPCSSFNFLMSWGSLFFLPHRKSTCEKQSPWNQNLAHQCTAWRCWSGFHPTSMVSRFIHRKVMTLLLPRMIKHDQERSGSPLHKGSQVPVPEDSFHHSIIFHS